MVYTRQINKIRSLQVQRVWPHWVNRNLRCAASGAEIGNTTGHLTRDITRKVDDDNAAKPAHGEHASACFVHCFRARSILI